MFVVPVISCAVQIHGWVNWQQALKLRCRIASHLQVKMNIALKKTNMKRSCQFLFAACTQR